MTTKKTTGKTKGESRGKRLPATAVEPKPVMPAISPMPVHGNASPNRMVVNPGELIASYRKEQGLTMTELARLADVSMSTISRIENGRISPTYDVLARISAALNVRWPDMVSGNEPAFAPGCRALTRAGSGAMQNTSLGLYQWLGADLVTKTMEPILIQAIEDTGTYDLTAHLGEEFIYVTDGTVKFVMRDYAPAILHTGDSMYFDASTPHACFCVDGPARFLSVLVKREK